MKIPTWPLSTLEPLEPLAFPLDRGGPLLGEYRRIEDDDPLRLAQLGSDLTGQLLQQGQAPRRKSRRSVAGPAV